MPYYSESNSIYEQNCKNIENIYHEGATLEKEQIVLDCINEFYNITVDDESIESDFIFYHYSKSGVEMRTFFMLISIDDLKNGKHIIKIEEELNQTIQVDLKIANGSAELSRDSQAYIIPFYIFKD